jgi:hypothetical protein
MFNRFKTRKQLRDLQETVECKLMPIWHKSRCDAGVHEWETFRPYSTREPPYIACKHCLRQPKKEG